MTVQVANLVKKFGALTALDRISVDFPPNSVTVIIGPNGAGKSTLLNIIGGFLAPTSGTISLISTSTENCQTSSLGIQDITQLSPNARAVCGMGTLFQDIRIFKSLSALDNVLVGINMRGAETPIRCLVNPISVARIEKAAVEKARYYLNYVGLSEMVTMQAGHLSFGQQKLLAIARMLASDVRLLLLDEPTSGLHAGMVETIVNLINELVTKEKKTVLMVEHNLSVAERAGEWICLMKKGRIAMFGKGRDVLASSFPSNYE